MKSGRWVKEWALLLLLLSYSADGWTQSKSLTASVSKVWTVDDARQEAFQNLVPQIDTQQFNPVDPFLITNRQAVAQHKGIVGNYKIGVFSGGDYAISPLCSLQSFYYHSDGTLFRIDYSSSPDFYNSSCPVINPSKGYVYSYPEGILMRIGITTSDNEDFVFNPNGSLGAHWVGDKCYNSDGSSCGSRTSFVANE